MLFDNIKINNNWKVTVRFNENKKLVFPSEWALLNTKQLNFWFAISLRFRAKNKKRYYFAEFEISLLQTREINLMHIIRDNGNAT